MVKRTASAFGSLPLILIVLGFALIFIGQSAQNLVQIGIGLIVLGLVLQVLTVPRRR